MELQGPRIGPLSGLQSAVPARISLKRKLSLRGEERALGSFGNQVVSFLFVASLSVCWSGGAYGAVPQGGPGDPLIRVLVAEPATRVRIEGFDLAVWRDGGRTPVYSNPSKARVPFECEKNRGVRIWGQLQSTPGPYRVESRGGFLRMGSQQFRGELWIYGSPQGQCFVVNKVNLEKYVAGVLSGEMHPSWSMEALKAQAVAARTYVLYQRRINRDKPDSVYDVDSTVRDQVYPGAHREEYRVEMASRATRGMVLTYRNELLKAFYHSTCGGETVDASKIMGKGFVAIRGVSCGYCHASPRFRWSVRIPRFQLEVLLRAQNVLNGSLKDVELVRRGDGAGRPDAVRIISSKGSVTRWPQLGQVGSVSESAVVSGVAKEANPFIDLGRLRSIIGLNVMKSGFVDKVRLDRGVFEFDGRGFGHGVGLCQWGARGMADHGASFRKILSHYYPKARIEIWAYDDEVMGSNPK